MGFGDKYNMIKEFLKSWYNHLGRTGSIWSAFTVFIVLFLYKCPKVLNNMYISVIAYVNEVPYLGDNIAPLNYTVKIVITVICWALMLCLLSYMNINILVLVYQLKPEYFARALITMIIGIMIVVAYSTYAWISKVQGYSLGVLFYNSTLWILLLIYSIFSKIWVGSIKQSEKEN